MKPSTAVPIRELTIGGAKVSVFRDAIDLCAAAAEQFFLVVAETLGNQNVCNIALAGGSTPKALYSLIADRSAREPELKQLAWSRVKFFFGDERCVPADHPDSNFGMVKRTLLAEGLVPLENVHRVLTERAPEEAATLYEKELTTHFGGKPRFDLVLLGIGADGHTASLFPDTEALRVSDRYVVSDFVPKLAAQRITLTLSALNAANRVLFLVIGTDKRQVVQSVLREREPLPAARVKPAGPLLWFLDQSAAADVADANS